MDKAEILLAAGSFVAGLAVGHYLFVEKSGKGPKGDIAVCDEDACVESNDSTCHVAESAKLAASREEQEIAEAIFFPDEGYACDDFMYNPAGCENKEDECRFVHKLTNLGKMCKYLRNAQNSIDVCVMTLCSYQLVQSLLHALDNGVSVRIILDHTMAVSSEKQLMKLGPKGALIHEAKSNYLMHNKFAVIDKKIVMTGSLNWTLQGSNANYENVVIFSKNHLVQQYADNFENLWEAFADLRVPDHPAVNCPKNKFNPLKKAAWDDIIVGFQAPVDNYNSCGNRISEPRRRRC